MLRRTFVLVVLVVVAAAFLPAWGDSTATLRVRVATAQETILAPVSPPTVTCVGGQPSGNPYMPCSPDTRQIRTRGAVYPVTYKVTAGPAELFAGTNELSVNCNFDANMHGICWGTFKWTVKAPFLGDPGEFWEGVFFGDMDLVTYIANTRGVGYGRGNRLEGLQVEFQVAYPGLPEMTGTMTARVADPQTR